MAIRNIVKEGDPILNKVCRPVTNFDDRLATLLDDMRETMIAADGHGGNVELRELVKQQGFNYVKENFQYSILENYNARMDDEYILKRESWWKETLCTRTHGYNKN